MSKKLIAVSAAAALALTGLVGIAPANATAATIAYTTATGTGTAADPFKVEVPSDNTLIAGDNALGIVVSGLTAGDTVTVSSSGSAKVTTDGVPSASTLIKVTDFGAASATDVVASGATSSFWVYGTSIATASTITIAISETDAGVKSTQTVTKVFQPTIGPDWNITDITIPSTMAASTEAEVTFKVKDVFGNERKTGSTIATALVSPGTVATLDASGTASWDANRGVWAAKFTSPANTRPFVIEVKAGSNQTNTGLGASALANNLFVINNTGASAQVTTLTAQVAALQAIVDRKVTKKRFNTLARKWNAAFPSQKVKLKK
jgi:hypothetical protein